MKTTERFDRAVMKLYNAFHENRLNGLDCAACAVGNICDNNGDWARSFSLIIDENYINYTSKKANSVIKKTGYSHVELANIEQLFVNGYNFIKDTQVFEYPDLKIQNSKETQFKGLCAVIEYLCELDNIPNIMDYTKLFETENNAPKYQLS